MQFLIVELVLLSKATTICIRLDFNCPDHVHHNLVKREWAVFTCAVRLRSYPFLTMLHAPEAVQVSTAFMSTFVMSR